MAASCSTAIRWIDAISMLRVREAYRLMTEKKEFTKEIMLRAADEIYFVPEGTPLQHPAGENFKRQ